MKSLTKKYPELSVILIHHTRKMKSDNPMENMSGTTGLTGATEINMVLESRLDIGEVEAKIAINGKDPKSQRLNIKFNELQELELELFEYVNWYNTQRLHGSLGYIPPMEYKKLFN